MRATFIVLPCLLFPAGAFASSVIDLLDTTGDATSVSMSWMGDGLCWAGGAADGFGTTSYADLMAGYLYSTAPDSEHTITIQDLVPSDPYELYIYTQGDAASAGRELYVYANGVEATTTATDGRASTFIAGQNYLDLSVTADATGDLTVSYSSSSQMRTPSWLHTRYPNCGLGRSRCTPSQSLSERRRRRNA
jgi:hypothetical protein